MDLGKRVLGKKGSLEGGFPHPFVVLWMFRHTKVIRSALFSTTKTPKAFIPLAQSDVIVN
jgi:hypothetical protein